MRFSSAPSTWASNAFSSGVTKRSAPTMVCRRSQLSGTRCRLARVTSRKYPKTRV